MEHPNFARRSAISLSIFLRVLLSLLVNTVLAVVLRMEELFPLGSMVMSI